jgi:serine/threonine-protein kinase
VQEYVESRSLDELYTDALLCGIFCSERFVLHVAAEVASALHAAHTRGILHRELHPERIQLSTQGQVKLEGFGLATSLSQAPAPVVYFSPEQLLQRPVEARSDLFSLGLIMLELLTGQHLYRRMEDVDLRGMGLSMAALSPGTLKIVEATVNELGRLHERARRHEGLAELTQRATSFDFEDVERLAREVPEPTRFILHKLLRPVPQERYGSAAELEWALRERLHALGPYGAREASEEAFLLQAQAAGLALLEDLELGEEDQELGPFPPGEPEEVTTQPC